MSLLLQKVFTKDRLKAILLQEEEEDQTKVQNLQQDLEGKDNSVYVFNGHLHVYIDMNMRIAFYVTFKSCKYLSNT